MTQSKEKCNYCYGGDAGHGRECGECNGTGYDQTEIRSEGCPDCNAPRSTEEEVTASIGGVGFTCSTCHGKGHVLSKFDKDGEYVGMVS